MSRRRREDVLGYAAGLLGLPPPPEVPFEEAELTPMARSFYGESKRVRNDKIKRELGVCLVYRTYREGLLAVSLKRKDRSQPGDEWVRPKDEAMINADFPR